MNRSFLALCALALSIFAAPALAQTSAVLPVTCNPNKPGDCIRALPVVNPDGTNIGAGGGGGGDVTVTNWPTTQTVSGTVTATGPLTNAQLTAVTGTATSAAWNGTDASATLLSILRAMYAQFNLMNTLLGEIDANTQPIP